MSKHLVFGQATDRGNVLGKENEDSIWSFLSSGRSIENVPDFGVFVVADGLGGQSDGQQASAFTVRTVITQIVQSVYLPLLVDHNASPPLNDALTHALEQANHFVNHETHNGGATIVTAVLVGNLAHIAHMGDSRAYLVTSTGIEKLTDDHSLVNRLYQEGSISTSELQNHPMDHVIYRAVGGSDEIEVDIIPRRLPPDSSLVLCCDGLWKEVDPEDIRLIVRGTPNPQDAANKLVQLANDNGGHDNISVIVINLPAAD